MKTLNYYLTDSSFLKEVNDAIEGYVNEMNYNEGMESHLSDFFTDTLYTANLIFGFITDQIEESVIIDLKNYIECEVRDSIKKRDKL